MRVEDVFEQQSVCVTGTTLTDAVEKVVIERPEQLKVAEPRNAPAIYPPDVFRSCDAGVQPPVVVRERKPMWPVGRKVGGTVVLRAVVDSTGRVRDMRIVRSVDPSMDAAVQDAVGEWRFRSGVLNGAPVPVVVTIEVTMAGS